MYLLVPNKVQVRFSPAQCVKLPLGCIAYYKIQIQKLLFLLIPRKASENSVYLKIGTLGSSVDPSRPLHHLRLEFEEADHCSDHWLWEK